MPIHNLLLKALLKHNLAASFYLDGNQILKSAFAQYVVVHSQSFLEDIIVGKLNAYAL
jgi:hypothetical protein